MGRLDRWTWMLVLLTGCAAKERPYWEDWPQREERVLKAVPPDPTEMGPPIGREFGEGSHAVDFVNRSWEARFIHPLQRDEFPVSARTDAKFTDSLRVEPCECVRIWRDYPTLPDGARILIRTMPRTPITGSWEGMGWRQRTMPTHLQMFDAQGEFAIELFDDLNMSDQMDLVWFMEVSAENEDLRRPSPGPPK